MLRFGLTTSARLTYVPLLTFEVESFLERSPLFRGRCRSSNIPAAMAEITLQSASRALQGIEVRSKFDSTFVELYHDLDTGFSL